MTLEEAAAKYREALVAAEAEETLERELMLRCQKADDALATHRLSMRGENALALHRAAHELCVVASGLPFRKQEP